MKPDLLDELSRTSRQREAMQWLLVAGVPRPVLTTPAGIAGAFGVATIQTSPDGTYEPAHTGTGAIVIGVHGPDLELVDLCAFHPASPGCWHLRLGLAEFLGAEAVDKAAFLREFLKLYRTPLLWMRGGCQGACVLDWRIARTVLLSVPELVAEDLDHGEEMERRLRERDPLLPRISIQIGKAA